MLGPPNDPANTAQNIKKLTLPDGSRVGLRNLDTILRAVAELKLTDNSAIKSALLQKTKAINYVAESAENEYTTALFLKYQRKFGSGLAHDNVNTGTSKLPGG